MFYSNDKRNYDFFKSENFSMISATTPFTCPAGFMPNVFDKYGTSDRNINYRIEAVTPDNTTSIVGPTVLKPSGGRGLCRYGPMNLIATLVPAPRSADMFVSVTVKGARSVTFLYKYGSTTSAPYTVRIDIYVNGLSLLSHEPMPFSIFSRPKSENHS